jgi:hypothetical protein
MGLYGLKTEVRRQESEDRSPKSGVRSPESEDRSPESGVRTPKSEDRSPKSEDRSSKPGLRVAFLTEYRIPNTEYHCLTQDSRLPTTGFRLPTTSPHQYPKYRFQALPLSFRGHASFLQQPGKAVFQASPGREARCLCNSRISISPSPR